MEEISFYNRIGQRLVGTYYPKQTKKMIILVHGFVSDKSSDGRFEQIAECFAQDFAVLRFDASGCGESGEGIVTVASRVRDLNAALSWALSHGYDQLALYGHSLGSRICLEAVIPQVKAMVLTGALTGPMLYDWDTVLDVSELEQLQREGYTSLRRESLRWRKEMFIEWQSLYDFAQIEQEQLLTPIQCPVLIIHGNGDEEERALTHLSQSALHFLPASAQLHIIEGAKHHFYGFIQPIAQQALAWYRRWM
ncbi:alpha/beta hydrolase [Mechercharimyces sp. CAU 1602]|uniref:alpha/beta hydrolase n=1 Tax=Mechercharimyces sp. CAU 1602 TaxID=2973933 RepID=UPI00216188E2|nr:alpha/beta hydrolase [Mechercharimyces sp. CAU 1602]MCS1350863.1 alpha/beta hydrolase [Mechercharimyces sp. CAU 1602]